MNYLKIYCNLMRKMENRTPPEGYTEKHHIFPKSIFGNNNRIVVLTAREHYIAHALLEKICIKRYGLKHWKTIKMNFAHISMKGNRREYFNSYLYENARKRRSECVKGISINKGYKHSQETKLKMSKVKKGVKWWNNGIVDIRCKDCPGSEWKNGRLNVQYGRIYTEETKKKISNSRKGKKYCGNIKKGSNNPMFGKKRPEHSELMKNNFNYFLKNNIIYEVIDNNGNIGYTGKLNNFCKANDLDYSAMNNVSNFKYRQYKGWIVNKIYHNPV